jgi:hypothetical protein
MSFNGYGLTPARPARACTWLGAAGIAVSLLIMIAVSLARASWMLPALPMPRTGPPWELAGWHLQQGDVTVALWASALAGGLGLAAGLVAVRRGARPPLRLLLVAAALAVAVLTVLPPAGSTDALDYMAFGRIVVLGHTPYVMVPWDLMRLHDVVARSIPVEWDKNPTPYGPAATGCSGPGRPPGCGPTCCGRSIRCSSGSSSPRPTWTCWPRLPACSGWSWRRVSHRSPVPGRGRAACCWAAR